MTSIISKSICLINPRNIIFTTITSTRIIPLLVGNFMPSLVNIPKIHCWVRLATLHLQCHFAKIYSSLIITTVIRSTPMMIMMIFLDKFAFDQEQASAQISQCLSTIRLNNIFLNRV